MRAKSLPCCPGAWWRRGADAGVGAAGWAAGAVDGAAAGVAALLLFAIFADLSATMRNHKSLRYLINPLNSVYALGMVASEPLRRNDRVLLPLARSEGLLACGIVDLHTGDLLATQQREEPATDLAALAEALCAARLAHQAVATDEAPPEEILVTTGPRQTLLRRLPGEAPLGFVAVLDRQQANLALLRFKLLDAERVLG